MKTVGTKLDNSEYDIFEFCCSENGLNKSEQLRNLIKNFTNKKTNGQVISHELNTEQIPQPTITIVSDD